MNSEILILFDRLQTNRLVVYRQVTARLVFYKAVPSIAAHFFQNKHMFKIFYVHFVYDKLPLNMTSWLRGVPYIILQKCNYLSFFSA